MKTPSIIALLLALSSPVSAQAPADSEHLQAARDLVDIITPPAEREKMFETILNSFMANQLAGMMQGNPSLRRAFEDEPKLRPVFASFVERQRQLALGDLRESGPQLVESYAAAYARNFTVAELLELRRFFATPTGAKYVSRSAALMTDPALGEWQRAVAARAEARKTKEVQRLIEEIAPIIEAMEQHRKRHGS
jgi:hypothetical protein